MTRTITFTANGGVDGFAGSASGVGGTFDNINIVVGGGEVEDILNGPDNGARV